MKNKETLARIDSERGPVKTEFEALVKRDPKEAKASMLAMLKEKPYSDDTGWAIRGGWQVIDSEVLEELVKIPYWCQPGSVAIQLLSDNKSPLITDSLKEKLGQSTGAGILNGTTRIILSEYDREPWGRM